MGNIVHTKNEEASCPFRSGMRPLGRAVMRWAFPSANHRRASSSRCQPSAHFQEFLAFARQLASSVTAPEISLRFDTVKTLVICLITSGWEPSPRVLIASPVIATRVPLALLPNAPYPYGSQADHQ